MLDFFYCNNSKCQVPRQSIGHLISVVLQAIVVISVVVDVVLCAANNAPDVPNGILAALAEEAQTPASAVVAAVPVTIARDRPPWGRVTRNDGVVVVTKTMTTTTIVPQQQQRQQR